MLRKSSLSSFDINSSASYTEKSISWSSWSTSLTIPDEDDQQMIVDDHRTIEADYQHPNRQRLRSLSMDEKKLHRKSSFIGSKTDFGDCEDRGVASNLLEDIIQCSTKDRKQKILIFSSSYPYHIEWANSEWSKISGWSSDEISGKLYHSFVRLLH
jgi:PAS domain-containing protein